MGFEPDPETATRILWLMAAGMFLVAIVSAIGELLGWWDLIGELGMALGTGGGLLLSGLAILSGSSRRQVDAVHGRLVDVHQAVLANGRQLGKLDRLEKLDELDVIQTELDVQTGVLGDQLTVLEQIRDSG